MRDPAGLLLDLDRYEGPEYRRVRIADGDGTACWTYLWAAGDGALTPPAQGWQR